MIIFLFRNPISEIKPKKKIKVFLGIILCFKMMMNDKIKIGAMVTLIKITKRDNSHIKTNASAFLSSKHFKNK